MCAGFPDEPVAPLVDAIIVQEGSWGQDARRAPSDVRIAAPQPLYFMDVSARTRVSRIDAELLAEFAGLSEIPVQT
jgi:hypothetical protein